jgi:crotonobetainyl-CoA:carnitine CoA-transferase CaiB-like acyl-CoA transferase
MSASAAPAGAGPRAVFEWLWSAIGLTPGDLAGRVDFTGADPVVPSVHRVGTAAAAAMGAMGAAVAAIWKQRAGEGQDVAVDIGRAMVPGLQTVAHLYQDGYRLDPHPRGTDFRGFFRTRDGRQMYLLRTLAYPEILTRLLDVLDCGYNAASFERAVGRWHSEELEEALARARAVGVLLREREEWLRHPQGQWLAARPAVQVEKIGESDPIPLGPANRPLAGLRVVDFTHVLAGPTVARLMAEQGADVLHVSPPWRYDSHAMLLDTGWGKRSALLDLEQPGEAERLRTLAQDADLFVQSWRPGSLERAGFGRQDLAALRPGIIYVSVSCYGSGGPWRERGGFEPIGQVACGLAADEGSMDDPRMAPTGTMNDYLVPYLAAAGTLAALLRRAREGGSYHVEVSLTRASMFLQEIGRLGEVERARIPSAMPAPDPRSFITAGTAYGDLRVPGPVVVYSKTPAYWERPPCAPGQHPLAWARKPA